MARARIGSDEWMAATRAPTPLVHGLLRARRGLRRARSRLGPTAADVIERTLAVAEVRALGIAAELDLAALVHERPRSTAELAEATGTDPDALERLLELLAATGCFARAGRGGAGPWKNTRTSDVLRGDHPQSMRSWARFFGGGDHLRIWAAADASIRTGASATEAATGRPFFDWLAAAPDQGRLFDGAMQEASRFVAEGVAATVELPVGARICDVGGGTGALLARLLAEDPRAQGVLFDLPEVVARAGPVLDAAGVAERVERVGGSFFEEVPAGADRYVLLSVVHDWADEPAATILGRCREAAVANPGARVVVVDQVLDPSRPPLGERHSDLLMLVLSGSGRERSDEAFGRLFATAGLEVTRQWDLPSLHRAYELAPSP